MKKAEEFETIVNNDSECDMEVDDMEVEINDKNDSTADENFYVLSKAHPTQSELKSDAEKIKLWINKCKNKENELKLLYRLP